MTFLFCLLIVCKSVKCFFFHKSIRFLFKRECYLSHRVVYLFIYFAATGVLFLWKMSLICIGHLKMNILFWSLLASVAWVCRYSSYVINSLVILPLHAGHGSESDLIRWIILLLVLEKVLSKCYLMADVNKAYWGMTGHDFHYSAFLDCLGKWNSTE